MDNIIETAKRLGKQCLNKGVKLSGSKLFWLFVLCGMILKYLYYGATYFPVLDDHNMYGVFSLYDPWYALVTYKWYTSRIFASLFDIYFVSRLWNFQWLVLIIITIMQFVSMVLFYKVLKKNNVTTGALMVLIYGFCPLGFEASYWIAASSRVIVGLFFVALSAYFLMVLIDRMALRKKGVVSFLMLFVITNLLSLGFYEQVIVVGFLLIAFIMIKNYSRIRYKLILTIPFVNLGIMAGYYKYFMNEGVSASRSKLITGNYIEHTRFVFERMKWAFIDLPYEMMKNGLKNFYTMLQTDGISVYFASSILLAIIISIFYSREDIKASLRQNLIKLLFGLIAIISTFAPFFVLDMVWVCPRNAFPAFLGIGLVAESIVGILLFHRVFEVKWLRSIRGILMGLLFLSFMCVNAVELRDNRNISMLDKKIIKNFILTISESKNTKKSDYKALLLNSKSTYIATNSDRLGNCTGNDWGFVGALQSINRNKNMGTVIPVAENGIFTVKKDDFKDFIYIGIDSNARTFPLNYQWEKDGSMSISTLEGQAFGYIKMLPDNRAEFKITKTEN